MSSDYCVTTLPPTDEPKPQRPTEDALFQSVSYYLENYDGRGVPETIIREMHQTLLPGLYDAGQYRSVQVHIEGAIIVPPEPHQVGWMMREALDTLRDSLGNATNDYEKRMAIIAFFHRFNAIHPFRDGNGRVSRAVLHLLLRQQDCLDTRNDFYDVFALRRDEYLEAMKEGDQGDLFHLRFLVMTGMLDASLKDVLESPVVKAFKSRLSPEWQAWYNPTTRAAVSLDDYLQHSRDFLKACDDL